jgi:hypothetical protein
MVLAVSRDFAATFPLARFPNPRRADARRSRLACVRIPQEWLFLRRPEDRAPRSGWRKPAVVFGNKLAVARSQLSRRGERSMVCARTPLQLRYHTHGGLTPAAPGCPSGSCRTMLGFCVTAFVLSTHGGLTPAAPGLSIWQLPNNARFLRYSVGIAYPRRADAPPLLVVHLAVAEQCAVFALQRWYCLPTAG